MLVALLLLHGCTEVYLNKGDEEIVDDTAVDDDTDDTEDTEDTDPVDADGDGYFADVDCNDDAENVNPGAPELCNRRDDDCDGDVDEDLAVSDWYADTDEDGYGSPDASRSACAAPDGYVADAGDCDDADLAVNPAAPEACNGIDDDCDGFLDGDDPAMALSSGTVTLGVTYCWPTSGCDFTDWPLDAGGTWALSKYTGVWTWDACTGELEIEGGNTIYWGTSADRVNFSGTMHTDNGGGMDGTWTGVLR